MNPIKALRKLAKALRGGATFSQVFIGVFLGFALGMMPGVNLTMIIILALLLLLNSNGGVAALAIFIGKAACLILAPLTFRIGYALIHDMGFSGIVRTFGDTPVLALMDLHVYCLIGALPIILLGGGALAFAAATFFKKFHEATAKAGAENERYQKMMENKAFAALLWLVAGGKKKEDDTETKQGLILKGRIVAGAILTAVICLVSYLYLDTIARFGMVQGLQSMTGAEVNIDSVSLSVLSGKVEVRGLQVTDPATPANNQVQAATIKADLDVAALLTRRFVVDEVYLENVKTDAKRSSPGEVYVKTEGQTTTETTEIPEGLGAVRRIKLYYDKVKEINTKAQEIRKYLNENDPGKMRDNEEEYSKDLAEQARLGSYLTLSAKDVLSEKPTWLIKKITAKKLEASPMLPTMKVEAANISSAPSLVEEKQSIRVLPDEDAVAALKKKLAGGLGDSVKSKVGDVGSKIKGLFGK